MYSLRHRLGIAISVSTLAIVVSYPVIAKPLPRSKQIIASQVTTKAAATINVSRQPTDAILANVRLKSSMPANVGKAAPRSVTTTKSVARTTKTSKHVDADRSSQGTETFTKIDQTNRRTSKSSGLDRWVD
jgi:dUTPase